MFYCYSVRILCWWTRSGWRGPVQELWSLSGISIRDKVCHGIPGNLGFMHDSKGILVSYWNYMQEAVYWLTFRSRNFASWPTCGHINNSGRSCIPLFYQCHVPVLVWEAVKWIEYDESDPTVREIVIKVIWTIFGTSSAKRGLIAFPIACVS